MGKFGPYVVSDEVFRRLLSALLARDLMGSRGTPEELNWGMDYKRSSCVGPSGWVAEGFHYTDDVLNDASE
jgi:hypothetical protein